MVGSVEVLGGPGARMRGDKTKWPDASTAGSWFYAMGEGDTSCISASTFATLALLTLSSLTTTAEGRWRFS